MVFVVKNLENILVVKFPDLSKEWHPTKNGKLTPSEVTYGSDLEVWWLCQNDHAYIMKIHSRGVKKYGCPFCSGTKVSLERSLYVKYPNIAKEWHSTKNDQLTPKDVFPSTRKIVWWKCRNGHEWQMAIRSRTSNKSQCKLCSENKKAEKRYLTEFEYLLQEWHPYKNDTLNPEKCTSGSSTKAWWLCKDGHEWESRISHRVNGSSCPYCTGQKCTYENSLESLYPEIALEWNNEKNKLKPSEVSPQSNKKVWWKCSENHEWQAIIGNRYKGNGCPMCKGKIPNENKSISKNPKLYELWNFEKNIGVSPNNVLPRSGAKYWWKCDKCGHEWKATPHNMYRTSGKICPKCNGRYVDHDNCFATLHPTLLKEFDFEKNKKIDPFKYVPGSIKRVWWRCEKGHEWITSIRNRALKGNNCPTCYAQTSFPEQVVYFYLKKIFKNAINRKKFKGETRSYEADIFIPELNLAIEYDGAYFHKDKLHKDEEKNIFFLNNNIELIRMREIGLHDFVNTQPTIFYCNPQKFESFEKSISELLIYISKNYSLSEKLLNRISKLQINIKRDADNISESIY